MNRSGFIFTVLSTVLFLWNTDVNAQFNLAQVRTAFKEAAAEHFEIVGDDLGGIDAEKRPGDYWLVRIKAKVPGNYAVKYSFRYNDRFYTNGEVTIPVRFGPARCDRMPSSEQGVSGFCFGDTAILPIRTGNRYNYEFAVTFTKDNTDFWQPRKPSGKPEIKSIANPLAANMKLIDVGKREMPHRNAGASTITYHATFEAIKTGKFNLALSGAPPVASSGGESGGTPILIVNPGRPITHLASYEDTTNYADEGKFSSHSGGNFPTNVVIMQPGDQITFNFFSATTLYGPFSEPAKGARSLRPDLFIQKYPFQVDSDLSYNSFIEKYFRY